MKDFETHRLSARYERIQQAYWLLGRLLFEGDTDEWLAAKDEIQEHLTETDLASLAFVSLRCLPDDVAMQVSDSAMGLMGAPVPPLNDDVMQDARWWADGASERELKAYSIACYHRMSPRAREGFRKWVMGQ